MFGFWIDSFGESRRLIGGAERSQRKADKPGQRPERLAYAIQATTNIQIKEFRMVFD